MEIPPLSQDKLVTGLAHRMNNILTLFHGYVGLLLDNSELDESTRRSLLKIKDGASAASHLIDRTHSLVNKSKLNYREVDLPFFLSLLQPTFQALCSKGVTLEIICAKGLPPIWTDATKLKVILMELLRNACDATAEAGGKISIHVRREEEMESMIDPWAPAVAKQEESGNQWVSISVTDEGEGIAPEALSRMFEPFYTTRKKKQAAGLGLNVATEAVQQLGGMMSYTSKARRTCFTLLLPHETAAVATPKATNAFATAA